MNFLPERPHNQPYLVQRYPNRRGQLFQPFVGSYQHALARISTRDVTPVRRLPEALGYGSTFHANYNQGLIRITPTVGRPRASEGILDLYCLPLLVSALGPSRR